MTTVAIATFGCKVNQFESEAMIESLVKEGYEIVPPGEKADITIINTCTVTHRADVQSRQMARRVRRSNAATLLIVTGCYAQVDPEGLARLEEVNYLLGNQEKGRMAELLPLMEGGRLPRVQVENIQEEALFTDMPLPSFRYHTRAFLKIQDGCDARCSYCIVPEARGRSRSLAPERVLRHLKELKEGGYQEAVLTGIHLGAYGLDLRPPVALEALLEQVERGETPPRIRLTSIEPGDFSPGLIPLLSQSVKICPHLHIPIQSGDNEILKGMNRNYDRSFLSDLIQKAHEGIPGVSIGADVIAGFPGETDGGFQNTFDLISSLPLTYLHVFPFSRRKLTAAARFPGGVDAEKIRNRAEQLRALGKKKRQAFYRGWLGREVRVLVEERQKKGKGWRGLSRNYIPVSIPGEDPPRKRDRVNEEVRVEVTGLTAEKGVTGRIVEG